MNPLLITPILEIGKSLINKFWPDPTQAAEAQERLLKMQQEGEFRELEAELQLQLAQIALNTQEAKSESLFKSGWRPYIGWVCGSGFTYQFFLRPLLQMIINLFGSEVVLVSLDMNTLLPLLLAMLGIGGLRTFEKYKGIN